MAGEKGGLREQKRRETTRRITDAGLKLFAKNGYEATTLDAIAAAAGISRRTFFHYFRSKDDILISMQGGIGERLVEALARQPDTVSPLQAMRAVMIEVAAPYSPEELLVVDRLMRASEAVQARKQASYIQDEAVVFEALRRRWPEESEMGLRIVAMLSIATTRLTLDAWNRDGGKRPLVEMVQETFAAFDALKR